MLAAIVVPGPELLLVGRRPMGRVGRAIEKGETLGFMTVVADAETPAASLTAPMTSAKEALLARKALAPILMSSRLRWGWSCIVSITIPGGGETSRRISPSASLPSMTGITRSRRIRSGRSARNVERTARWFSRRNWRASSRFMLP